LLASWLVTGCLVAGTFCAARFVLRAAATQAELESTVVRTAAARRERARFVGTRSAIAETAENVAEAVQLSALTVQVGHDAVVAVPFGVFEAIPATRAGTKRLRTVHDDASGGVYRAINVVSGAVGNVVSRRLKGSKPTE
jgi:hypothetical protein